MNTTAGRNRNRIVPNFLIVGAEKAGTTSLAAMLGSHPQVFMSTPKEVQFFSYHNWHRGVGWYSRFFHDARDFPAIGEASPAYTMYPEIDRVPRRIHEILGNVRYVYIVRHPVDRLISHYRHARYFRWIDDRVSLEDSFSVFPQLGECSRYYYQIEQYLPYTSRGQWHIVVFEEMISDPGKTFERLFSFLEVDASFAPELTKKNATDEKSRPPRWAEIFRRNRHVHAFLKRYGARAARFLFSVTGKKMPPVAVAAAPRAQLYERYLPDIRKLSEFVGRDFETLWPAK